MRAEHAPAAAVLRQLLCATRIFLWQDLDSKNHGLDTCSVGDAPDDLTKRATERRSRRRRRIPWEPIGAVAAVAAVVVGVGAAMGWFADEPASVQSTALTATDVSAWLGNKKLVGGQLLVLNNIGGRAKTILWIGALSRIELYTVLTTTPVGIKTHSQRRSKKHRHLHSPQPSSPKPLPTTSAPTAPTYVAPGETSIQYWSVDTCQSGAVPITMDRPYVLLINPRTAHGDKLAIPLFPSEISYRVHLNDGSAILVSPGRLPNDFGSSFQPTADSIVKNCAHV